MQSLKFIREGGETKRYHTWTVLKEQNIAEHSFHVALLCDLLSPDGASANLLRAALLHDIAEHLMGDLPAPVKRGLPDYRVDYERTPFRVIWDKIEEGHMAEAGWPMPELTESEAKTLKLADAADGCLYCIRERMYGNKLINPVYLNFINYFEGLYDAVDDRHTKLRTFIVEGWARATR